MIRSDKRVLISGNQAVARGAYESGVGVATAYPGTPCTEILENLANYDHVQAMWSTNEKVAFDTALGASFAGARALVAMKHVGLNVAADTLFSAAYTGVNAGLVIVVGDDPSAHSSQNEQDSRHYARAAKVPMLEPADSQEAKDFVHHAFELSERFKTPVLLRLTTRLCHSRSGVSLGEPDPSRNGPSGFVPDPSRFVLLPRQALARHAIIEKRLMALSEYAEHSELNRIHHGDESLGIITSGVCYAYALEAFPTASILKIGNTFPLPTRLLRRFARSVEQLLVLEELDDFLEQQVKALGIETEGKSVIPRVGELSPERIRRSWQFRAPMPVENGDLTMAPRPPRICPGCQYLGIYTVIERLGVTVSGDIGCYTLGALPPFNSLDTVVCMGSSIGVALGMEKALGVRAKGNFLAVIGDGTLLHAGIPALLDMVYNQSGFTVLVMDNGTTAMTGLQGHAGNGVGLQQRQSPSIDLEKLLAAIGISWVRVVNAYDLANTERTLREALDYPGPAVVISRNPCLLLECKPPRQQAWVDRDACTGCGDCAQVGCVAVEFDGADEPAEAPVLRGMNPGDNSTIDTATARSRDRRRARINLDLCVGCTLCVQVCPEGAIAPRPVSLPLVHISSSGQS